MCTSSPTPVTTIIIPVDSPSSVIPMLILKLPTVTQEKPWLSVLPRHKRAITKVTAAEAVETR